ncbi:hypothetical protein DENIS_3204 [Desulfonema ishimotonii]|uniref:Uncharacterized protein n=2 Tax=Desulfonema ishimotonii TaxID=45657 RepID=A0A401FZ45_9BACT|nr:hypothetical protein DENIS_3204 [Desulfonema ishimotonii]
MSPEELREAKERFLLQLFEKTDGEISAQVSMYEVGTAITLEKDDAQKVAEELMADGLIEVRTLSGGIGITREGVEASDRKGAGGGSGARTLGDGPVIVPEKCEALDGVLCDLKARAGQLNLAFEPLSELVADFRTIDAQMASPNPKTPIVRACLESVRAVLQKAGDTEGLQKVQQMLGD